MTKTITVELLTTELFDVFTETFERVQGIYLDKGTSLFETLATITAEEASRPISATCASIAAQVEHVRYYLDVLVVYAVGDKPEKVDWGEVWLTVQTVDEAEWTAIQARLRASYQHVREVMSNYAKWDSEALAGALAMVVHTAYHLGEIRQALCVVKNG